MSFAPGSVINITAAARSFPGEKVAAADLEKVARLNRGEEYRDLFQRKMVVSEDRRRNCEVACRILR